MLQIIRLSAVPINLLLDRSDPLGTNLEFDIISFPSTGAVLKFLFRTGKPRSLQRFMCKLTKGILTVAGSSLVADQ